MHLQKGSRLKGGSGLLLKVRVGLVGQVVLLEPENPIHRGKLKKKNRPLSVTGRVILPQSSRYFYLVTKIVPQSKFGAEVLLLPAVLLFETQE